MEEKLTITWLGCASLKIETPQGSLLIDPYIQGRGSENHSDGSIFRGVDDILLTHGHFDHAQSIPGIVKDRENCKVYCTGNHRTSAA